MSMLAIRDLTCGYGAVLAARNITLSVDRGAILAVVGANGAGKTSTIMAAMGLVRITAGTVALDGRDITREAALQRPALGLAVVPEGRRLFNTMTVSDNLTVGAHTRSRSELRQARDRVFTLFPRLAERRGQSAGSMSGGEQQMLAIGRALMSFPKALLVDELSLGLMPKMVDLCLDTLLRLKAEGLAILLVEQNTDRALDVADTVAVLSSGRLVATGTPAEMRKHDDFFGAYLGLEAAPVGDAAHRAESQGGLT